MYLEVSVFDANSASHHHRRRTDQTVGRGDTYRAHPTVGFPGRTVHLISEPFYIVQTIANDDSLWCEIPSDAREYIRSTRFLLFTT